LHSILQAISRLNVRPALHCLYSDEWRLTNELDWHKPCYPLAAEEEPQEITDILAGVQQSPVSRLIMHASRDRGVLTCNADLGLCTCQ